MWTLQSLVLLIVLTQQAARADVIDFETLTDSEAVTNQFPGLTFHNASILISGVSLNELEFPPRSGVNVVFDSGSPLTIQFASPVLTVSGYFTYLAQLTMTAFDASDNQVGQTVSAFSSNLALSGDLGSSPNDFLSLSNVAGISKVSIRGDPSGGSFVLDDLNYTPSVPEPNSLVYILSAAALLVCWHLMKMII